MDTSRPSFRTNWTRLVRHPPPQERGEEGARHGRQQHERRNVTYGTLGSDVRAKTKERDLWNVTYVR